MLMFDGVLGLLMVGVWIFCIIDVITTPENQCRNLPKVIWLLIVLLLAALGSIVWLVAGRPWVPREGAPPRNDGRSPVPGRRPPVRRAAPLSPDDDEEFLASLRARAEEQRRRARESQQPDGESPESGAS
jgi:hypothetical protein